MKRNGWVWLLAAATVLACGTEEVGSGSLGGMPPTAGSQRCQERNGQSVPLTAGDTRMRFCRIDDALIEEFTLEKAVGDREDTRATEAFLEHDGAEPGQTDPARPVATYCTGVTGGTYLELAEEDGDTVGVCRYPDGSAMGAETLFAGPQGTGNLRLTSLLRHSGG